MEALLINWTTDSDGYAIIQSIVETAIEKQQNHHKFRLLIAIFPATY
jgi:hypothetical protein